MFHFVFIAALICVGQGLVIDKNQPAFATTLADNGDFYAGNWAMGKRFGFGAQYFAPKTKMASSVIQDRDIYVGDWEANLPSGRGTLLTASGYAFEAEWRLGKPQVDPTLYASSWHFIGMDAYNDAVVEFRKVGNVPW